ncbi:hypothetical protein ACFYNO_24310 [Kitasatospora sp. NPDC006697]|uniref:hypothetical protein n=1 Tax=Kitasatospora sp. NPDC006697 TaxID=3364020 RepID=UPI0036C5EE20
MKLTFLGSTSEAGDCPTLYETRTPLREIVVQGDQVVDTAQLSRLPNADPTQADVVVPRELLLRFAPRG